MTVQNNFTGLTLKLLKENLAMRAYFKRHPPVHIVGEDESWLDICRQYTGNAQRVMELLELNPNLSPVLLPPGTRVTLPLYWLVETRYTEEVFQETVREQQID